MHVDLPKGFEELRPRPPGDFYLELLIDENMPLSDGDASPIVEFSDSDDEANNVNFDELNFMISDNEDEDLAMYDPMSSPLYVSPASDSDAEISVCGTDSNDAQTDDDDFSNRVNNTIVEITELFGFSHEGAPEDMPSYRNAENQNELVDAGVQVYDAEICEELSDVNTPSLHEKESCEEIFEAECYHKESLNKDNSTNASLTGGKSAIMEGSDKILALECSHLSSHTFQISADIVPSNELYCDEKKSCKKTRISNMASNHYMSFSALDNANYFTDGNNNFMSEPSSVNLLSPLSPMCPSVSPASIKSGDEIFESSHSHETSFCAEGKIALSKSSAISDKVNSQGSNNESMTNSSVQDVDHPTSSLKPGKKGYAGKIRMNLEEQDYCESKEESIVIAENMKCSTSSEEEKFEINSEDNCDETSSDNAVCKKRKSSVTSEDDMISKVPKY